MSQAVLPFIFCRQIWVDGKIERFGRIGQIRRTRMSSDAAFPLSQCTTITSIAAILLELVDQAGFGIASGAQCRARMRFAACSPTRQSDGLLPLG